MTITRRTVLKMGAVVAGVLAFGGLAGCSSAGEAPAGSGAPEQQGADGAQGNSASGPSAPQEGASQQPKGDDATAAQQPSVQEPATSTATGAAVIFFSCTGNTKTVAEKIADACGGPLMEILPEEPYTSADLDYNADCRANDEQNEGTARPAIAAPVPDVANYSTIYLGFPIWWGKAPRIILTFLEGQSFAGKTIVPFCTSGSSAISGALPEIEEAAPDATWEEGHRFTSSDSESQIAAALGL